MPRFLNRLGLAFVVLMTSNAWALGLGEIKLNSALNEPLQAEIELLSATPEELGELTIRLASGDAFARYGLDRPAYLQGLTFEIVSVGRTDGNYVRVSSRVPMTEPFLTFLVEASWARGRLLREYTVLLDPPTFAPPPPQPTQQAVTAPQRAQPRDSGRIERPAQPAAEPAPRPRPRTQPRPVPAAEASEPPPPVRDTRPYATGSGDDYVVSRNETLWGIARSVRPDSRLTMNQTMLAIFEANPEAFDGNINILKAGARLRIPSADEVYQIDRRGALEEVQRQHSSWDGGAGTASPTPTPSYTPAPVAEPEPETEQPSLTLVPPDEEPIGIGTGTDETAGDEPRTREQEILDRLEEIEAAEVPTQQSLIDIRNDELANLREELRQIRGEPPLQEPAPEPVAEDDPFVADGSDIGVETTDEPVAETTDEAEPVEEAMPPPTNVIRSAPPEPTLVEKAVEFLSSFWMIIVGAVVAVAGILFFFMRRRGGDDEGSGVWALDAGDDDLTQLSQTTQTETMPAPEAEEAFLVEEQLAATSGNIGDTVEVPPPEASGGFGLPADDDMAETSSLDDTFSSETAVNLDQSDPIAEADFHMAYGLYDQAADLINGALEVEPQRQDLLTKLCEIYFVWGNRDSFVDAAERVKSVVGNAESAEWDKIVIMGQQIAADHALFAGAGVAGATKEVDLTFDAADGGGGDLDMVFGDDESSAGDDEGLDFMFEDSGTADVDEMLDVTQESPTIESGLDEGTAEMPAMDDDTLESALADSGQASDATAEIDLDDLGLDLDALDASSADDDMEITGSHAALGDDTDINKILPDLEEETGKNPAIDPNATGLTEAPDFSDLDATGIQETMKADMGDHADNDVDVDILAATGKTQILSDDMAVETINEPGGMIGDDAETLLASNMDDLDEVGTGTEVISDSDATMLAPGAMDEDFDFAKTEALPRDAFDADATAETPALASTDMDLDLDDLTAVLEASDGGDTVEMPRDEATVEQPRPPVDDATAEVPTMAFGEDDMSDDLSEARTMTEVGTKLDLARAYVDMGDPAGARSILEEVLDEGDNEQRQQAQQLLDSLPS